MEKPCTPATGLTTLLLFTGCYLWARAKRARRWSGPWKTYWRMQLDGGLVVVKTGHAGPARRVQIVEASHPIPDAEGVAAGRRILALAEEAGPDDLVVAVLSGGGSALLEAPAGLSLFDFQAMTDTLLACGATINEINCLRKHCSALKGGQLARAVYPAALVTLVLSDVVGSPLDVIASGPTVPDASTWADARSVLARVQFGESVAGDGRRTY